MRLKSTHYIREMLQITKSNGQMKAISVAHTNLNAHNSNGRKKFEIGTIKRDNMVGYSDWNGARRFRGFRWVFDKSYLLKTRSHACFVQMHPNECVIASNKWIN